MHTIIIRACLALALVFVAAGPRGAFAQDFLDQEWLLNPSLSNVYMQTVKANAVFETHQFTVVEGSVGKNGEANVKIELASIETGVDVRDVRMRFLLFETFKFPYAEISAKLDKAKLQALATETRIAYPLSFKLNAARDRRTRYKPRSGSRASATRPFRSRRSSRSSSPRRASISSIISASSSEAIGGRRPLPRPLRSRSISCSGRAASNRSWRRRGQSEKSSGPNRR